MLVAKVNGINNSVKFSHSYDDLYLGITFLGTQGMPVCQHAVTENKSFLEKFSKREKSMLLLVDLIYA